MNLLKKPFILLYKREIKLLRYLVSQVHEDKITFMDKLILTPPASVREMKILNRSAFIKDELVPSIIIPKAHLPHVLKKCKKYLLKLMKFNSIIGSDDENIKEILLNPLLISSKEDIKNIGIELDDLKGKFSFSKIEINYENWKAEQILRSVLPQEDDGCSGFSIIGHILHLNLREHLYPYKSLIGQVYLDKVPNISMVVNKVDIIDNSDNSFRSFSMEILAGERDDTIVTVKENNCSFKFDFSKVYWNPRLSTEHHRITSKLKCGDLFFDIMAGVGPFSIPAAKVGCSVFANDLNPHSFKALVENCSINKVTHNIQCFNLDGREFIRNTLPNILEIETSKKNFIGSIHITMNLPSIAVEFLPTFKGILPKSNIPKYINQDNGINNLPIMHVYLFSFHESKEYAVHKVASYLGYCIKEVSFNEDVKSIDEEQLKNNIHSSFWDHILEAVEVRRVAPAKVMFRVSFHIPYDFLVSANNDSIQPPKKMKT